MIGHLAPSGDINHLVAKINEIIDKVNEPRPYVSQHTDRIRIVNLVTCISCREVLCLEGGHWGSDKMMCSVGPQGAHRTALIPVMVPFL